MTWITRGFTRREKALLAALLVTLLALIYYQFVHIPVKEGIARAERQLNNLRTEYEESEAKLKSILEMKEEIDALGSLEGIARMPSYNAGEMELDILNLILTATEDYRITFASVTRNGDQIRRNFTIQYIVKDFDAAQEILRSLAHNEYRCMIGDVTYTEGIDTYYQGIYSSSNIRDDTYVTVNATATFFETMWDGIADAGLPTGR